MNNKPDISALCVCPKCGSLPSPEWVRGYYGWICGSFFRRGCCGRPATYKLEDDFEQSVTCAVTPYRQRAEKAEAELASLRKPTTDENRCTPSEFDERWTKAAPAVLQFIQEALRQTPERPRDIWASGRPWLGFMGRIGAALRAVGLQTFPSLPNGIADYPEGDILEFVRQAARYKSCDDPTVRCEGTSCAMRVLRINAPAWFENPAFLKWLNTRGTATWHAGQDEAHEYSDVFFTSCDGGSSDYPGTDDRPGIPPEIWEHLQFVVAEQFGWDAEVLVWVSNLI